MRRTTLVFLLSERRYLLMIWKKSGQGKGKWNVPGGKCEEGEDALAAAIRETEEETGLTPIAPRPVGQLEFLFPEGGSWPSHCSVFMAESFRGTLIPETSECRSAWVPVQAIPYGEMWESDRLWVPEILAGKEVYRRYEFDAQDRLIREIALQPTTVREAD